MDDIGGALRSDGTFRPRQQRHDVGGGLVPHAADRRTVEAAWKVVIPFPLRRDGVSRSSRFFPIASRIIFRRLNGLFREEHMSVSIAYDRMPAVDDPYDETVAGLSRSN